MAQAAPKKRAKTKRVVTECVIHVHASFNNTIITVTDVKGNCLTWSTAGGCGFRGSRKSTPYAAQVAAQDASQAAYEAGLRKVELFVKGPGSGRESAIRTIHFLTILRANQAMRYSERS